jgi:uncharacterized protein YjiS (DUF1127 family)
MHTISQHLTAFEATVGRIGAGYFRDLVRAAASRTFGTLLLWQRRAAFRDLVRAAASRAFGTLLLWQRRADERHALAHLDYRILRDLGLNRAEIAWESRKPFWRA